MIDFIDPVLTTSTELQGLVVILIPSHHTSHVHSVYRDHLLVRCFVQENRQDYFQLRRLYHGSVKRDVENWEEEEEGEEMGEAGDRDLFEPPPPAYQDVSQYQNVDIESAHTEPACLQSTHKLERYNAGFCQHWSLW